MASHRERTAILVSTALALVDDAEVRGARLRLLGGLGVYLACPEFRDYLENHRRPYSDIDIVTSSRSLATVLECFRAQDLEENASWRMLFGHQRRVFYTPEDITVELYIDRLVLCQRLDLRQSLPSEPPTLGPTDLFLSKIQRIGLSDADRSDLAALIAARGPGEKDGIDLERISALLASDWRWWKTFRVNLPALRESLPRDFPELRKVEDGLGVLEELTRRQPKRLRWRLRALLGDRFRWYDEVEDEQQEESM